MTHPEPRRGEFPLIDERVIVAPAVGVFHGGSLATGTRLREGDVVGELHGHCSRVLVETPFEGTLMGMLALDGERCRRGQPIAWLRCE